MVGEKLQGLKPGKPPAQIHPALLPVGGLLTRELKSPSRAIWWKNLASEDSESVRTAGIS